jgi:hypothetical protein
MLAGPLVAKHHEKLNEAQPNPAKPRQPDHRIFDRVVGPPRSIPLKALAGISSLHRLTDHFP